MSDVLTKEEREQVDMLRYYTQAEHLPQEGPREALAIIDRLVTEVERLRARNEKLERVREAAGAVLDRHGTVPDATMRRQVPAAAEIGLLHDAIAACESEP